MSGFLEVPGVKPAALDATVRDKINDPASEVRGALNATYASKEDAALTGTPTLNGTPIATTTQAAGAAAGLAIVFGGL